MIGLAGGCGTASPYQESLERPGFHWFLSARQDTPEAQLAYAHRLREAGDLSRASSQYKALTIYWPESPEAPQASYWLARTLEQRDQPDRAFDEYEYLIERYDAHYDYDDVLRRQFDLAVKLMKTPKARWLFFPGFMAPERAIPYLEKIAATGPGWRNADEAQYLIGAAYEQSHQEELAAVAYLTVENRFPDSPLAAEAAFHRAKCLYRLSQEAPNDDQLRIEALAAALSFEERYPDSPDRPIVETYRKALERARARSAFRVAQYYDSMADRPEAALTEYERFIRQFPGSEWSGLARARIEALKRETSSNHEPTTQNSL